MASTPARSAVLRGAQDPLPSPLPAQQLPSCLVFLSASAGHSESETYFHTVKYTLPHPLTVPDGYSWAVALRGLSLVNSQLVVNGYCNSFTVDGAQYALMPGNYSATGLAKALAALTPAVRWSFNSTTLQMVATTATGAAFALGGALCSELLDIADGSVGTVLTSRRTVRLTGVQSVFFQVDLGGSNIALRQDATTSHSTTLARVPCTAAPLTTLHYVDSSGSVSNVLFDSSIFAFTVTLTDENGRALLISSPYDATLEFTPVYTGRRDMRFDRPASLAYPPQPQI